MSVMVSYSSRLSGVTSGVRYPAHLVRDPIVAILHSLLALALVLCLGSHNSHGTESNAPPPSLSLVETTNRQQLLRTCLQIQEQLQATQLAVEQSRQEMKAVATQNAEAMSNGLQVLQEAFVAERAREIEAVRSANKVMLMVAGAFAGIGLLALFILTCFQWRTSNCLADIAAALPTSRGLGPASVAGALGPGGGRPALSDPTAQSNLGLLSALDQLDKRIHEFRQLVRSNGNGDPAGTPDQGAAAASDPAPADGPARIPVLLNRANSMMNSGKAEAAVACFDQVLALDPNHTEALVKKGAALERLHKLNEAIECYDRAIAVDSSMTTAYLHKGGLYNRLERFKEALQCYEKALRTHDQRGG
jgi:tetratricopeptide (TPR) repeat protein